MNRSADHRAKSAARRLERVAENAALKGEAVINRRKRPKSPPISKLKKLLWKELREVVYAESPNRCLTCGSDAPPVACHIVPSNDSAATKFFLPNIYRGCAVCNGAERRRRGQWVKKFEAVFGVDFVDALYEFSKTHHDIEKWWVLEQTERMRKIRAEQGAVR